MTDEERQLIQGLADRIRNAPAPQVDRDADALIRQSIGSRPDALYMLTQTVLIQEMALSQAKAQIEQLKNQTPPQPPASFLPQSSPAPAQPSGRSYGGGYQGSSYSSSQPQQPQQPPPIPQYQYEPEPQPQPSRFSSFLHNAAQTAAGVVAGEVAFSALSDIFGHRGGGGGFFGGGGGGYYGSPISPGSETIINNYYEGGQPGGGYRDDNRSAGFGNNRDLESAGLSPDLEDRRFAGDDSSAQDDNLPDDDNTPDDDNSDDSSFDDGSSYDDGSDSNDV
jgi:hypothetical protein